MNRADIAVIITCYNLGRTLREALNSVRAQTLAPAELVIVDDGSTDRFTQQTLAAIEAEGHDVVRTANRGVSAARNLGIQKTTSPYIVLLDADDMLHPRYLEETAHHLEANDQLAFVSCAMESFGSVREVWVPPPPDLITSLTSGVVHISTMFRRQVWEAVGGFDEGLSGHEDLDFWTGALEHGFQGMVLPEPLFRYRVRPESNYQRAIEPKNHVRLMDRFYRKHASVISTRMEELLLAKERFILEQKTHREQLHARRDRLEEELRSVRREISETVHELEALGHSRVDLGDLRRISPISPAWGLDRGRPLDRYYIEGFLERHRGDIRGRVLEIKDPGYTRAFGDARVTESDVLDIDASNEQATIIADLTRADSVPANSYDCFILTQTLGLIFDVRAALQHVYRILKPGGVLLCTVPAAGRISYESPGLDGDFWRFTEASVRRLFAEIFAIDGFEVTGFGNVLANAAFLYGLAIHELSAAELDARDPYFPLVYGIRAVKPVVDAKDGASSTVVHVGRLPKRAAPLGAILMYHRVATHETDRHRLCVAPLAFRSHMEALRDGGYTVLSLQEIAAAAQTSALPHRSVAITFDDGYVDGLTHAAPILAEFSFPATFFIVGRALFGSGVFWWDVLERVFLSDSPLPSQLHIRLPPGSLTLSTGTSAERSAAHDRLSEAFYGMSRPERDGVLREIMSWSSTGASPSGDQRPMTPDELRELAALPGMSIGAHTESHLLLPSQPDAVKRTEIVLGRQLVEDVIGCAVKSFAYPYGGYDEATVSIVREAGFVEAVTVDERPVTCGTHMLRLPRLDVRSTDVEFSDRLARFCAGTS